MSSDTNTEHTHDVEQPDQPELDPEAAEPPPPEPTVDEPVPFHAIAVEDGDGEYFPQVVEQPVWDRGYRTFIGEWWATKRRARKRKKLAKKGYVEWYLVDGQWPKPKYVKPTRNGAGQLEVKEDGNPYVFPEKAALPSQESGMPTYVHYAGMIDPINFRDPPDHAIPPDQMQEYADMTLQTSGPGLFSNMSLGDMIWYGFGIIIILAIAYGAMNGGLT